MSLCNKTNRKLHAVSRVFKYMALDKRRILIKYFTIYLKAKEMLESNKEMDT